MCKRGKFNSQWKMDNCGVRNVQHRLAEVDLTAKGLGEAGGIINEPQRSYSEGHEKALKDAIAALKDVLCSTAIAEHFKMSSEQVMNILGQQ